MCIINSMRFTCVCVVDCHVGDQHHVQGLHVCVLSTVMWVFTSMYDVFMCVCVIDCRV